MDEFFEKYFLAANSAVGFVSHFEDSYDRFDGWRAYIIKGGPGTGKSSFMRRVALIAKSGGLNSVLCPCSSDPDSLDAVIFEDIKVVIFDGTAPHTVEPSLAGACENIINLGDFWDKELLYKYRTDIIKAALKNKMLHKSAASFLLAAGYFLNDNIRMVEPHVNTPLLEGFTDRLLERIIPCKKGKKGKEWVRFIQGITPKGIVDFRDNVYKYKDRIIIRDDYSVCAPFILDAVRNKALEQGFEIISLKNPFLPENIDHILIPELSLAVLSENEYLRFDTEDRRIHARRFLDVGAVNRLRQKRRFNRKAFNEIIEAACKTLHDAKKSHDVLEKYYIEAMNFDKVRELAEKTAAEIISIAKEKV